MKKPFKICLLALLCIPLSAAVALSEKPAETNSPLELIQVLGCLGCHSMSGMGGSRAIDLTWEGGRLTTSDIMKQLTTDPQSRPDPNSFMPNYISVPKEDLQRISRYIYNLD
jgi:hypothetical protein